MKKNIFKTSLITVLFAGLSIASYADSPPPPPPDPSGGGNGPVGGGAPMGDGVALLVVLGAAYGGMKIFDARKQFNLKKKLG